MYFVGEIAYDTTNNVVNYQFLSFLFHLLQAQYHYHYHYCSHDTLLFIMMSVSRSVVIIWHQGPVSI